MPRTMLGNTEYLILAGVAGQARGIHGAALLDLLEERTGGQWSVGTVYTTLERLKHKGFVEAEWGEATPARGGRRKKIFRITATGLRAVQTTEDVRHRMSAGLTGVRPQEA